MKECFLFWLPVIVVVGACLLLAHMTKNNERSLRTVTAYCACAECCYPYNDGVTASGHRIKLGDMFVAAPAAIPFGTKIRVEGYNNGNWVKVLDRGGSIKDNRIDVYFDTHQEALDWGYRENVLVTIKKGE